MSNVYTWGKCSNPPYIFHTCLNQVCDYTVIVFFNLVNELYPNIISAQTDIVIVFVMRFKLCFRLSGCCEGQWRIDRDWNRTNWAQELRIRRLLQRRRLRNSVRRLLWKDWARLLRRLREVSHTTLTLTHCLLMYSDLRKMWL